MTPRRSRFVDEYMVDLNATQAAIRAGFSAKTAGAAGARLLKDVRISTEIEQRQQEIAQKNGVTREWIAEKLQENLDRAMQAVPVVDAKGNPTGEYRYEGMVANKAIELLGKLHGLFVERIRVEDVTKLSDEELEAIVRRGTMKVA